MKSLGKDIVAQVLAQPNAQTLVKELKFLNLISAKRK